MRSTPTPLILPLSHRSCPKKDLLLHPWSFQERRCLSYPFPRTPGLLQGAASDSVTHGGNRTNALVYGRLLGEAQKSVRDPSLRSQESCPVALGHLASSTPFGTMPLCMPQEAYWPSLCHPALDLPNCVGRGRTQSRHPKNLHWVRFPPACLGVLGTALKVSQVLTHLVVI